MAGIEQAPSPALRIAIATSPDGAPLVTLSGELDIANAGALEAVLKEIIAGKPADVFVDVRDLRFMDSAGIAILLGAAKTSRVHLRQPSEIVRRLIEVTGLTSVLNLES